MIKVLFVCLGNICRSPMADAVMQHLVEEAGLSGQIMVDSAGTGNWHIGERAHRGTRAVLNKHNIPYDGRARQLVQRDLTDFTYVLAMDSSNLRAIQSMASSDSNTVIGLFLHYANDAGLTTETTVPDPYYDGRFDYVYDLVTKGCEALLAHIREVHHL